MTLTQPLSISDQITLLSSRGLQFQNLQSAKDFLSNVSYFRLKGYWRDLEFNPITHEFSPNTDFQAIIDRYSFDTELRRIIFQMIEVVEISFRTKLIQILSMALGELWYLDPNLFQPNQFEYKGIIQTGHLHTIGELEREFDRSNEDFAKSHHASGSIQKPEAWKIIEVASFGTLSKLFKNLLSQLPEKSQICKEFQLNSSNILASWLESISILRNIVAHHSRIWNRILPKSPNLQLKNPSIPWIITPLNPKQNHKAFAILCCLLYLCNAILPQNTFNSQLKTHFNRFPSLPMNRLGFPSNWDTNPIWQ